MNKYNVGVFDFREELKLYGWLNLVNIFIVYVLMVVVYYLLLIYIMFVVVNEWMVFQFIVIVIVVGGVDFLVLKEFNILVCVFSLYLLLKFLQ